MIVTLDGPSSIQLRPPKVCKESLTNVPIILRFEIHSQLLPIASDTSPILLRLQRPRIFGRGLICSLRETKPGERCRENRDLRHLRWSLQQHHLPDIHKPFARNVESHRLDLVETQTWGNIGIPGSFEISRVHFFASQYRNLLPKEIDD
jgi:hypothetical protein